jgi:hypothetical protein
VRFALLFVIACGAPPPHATPADVERAASPTTLEELERGRTRYIERCGGCHRPYEPAKYAPANWPEHVNEMAERAKLAAGDRRLIELYLVTLSARPR